jgi:hypothetical protein
MSKSWISPPHEVNLRQFFLSFLFWGFYRIVLHQNGRMSCSWSRKTFPASRNAKYQYGRGTKCSGTNKWAFSIPRSVIFQRRASFWVVLVTDNRYLLPPPPSGWGRCRTYIVLISLEIDVEVNESNATCYLLLATCYLLLVPASQDTWSMKHIILALNTVLSTLSLSKDNCINLQDYSLADLCSYLFHIFWRNSKLGIRTIPFPKIPLLFAKLLVSKLGIWASAI